jgi:hypothetical protein
MSAAQERGTVVVLPPDAPPNRAVNPSMTRWVWNPYYTINNRGPISLARHFGAGHDHRYETFEQGAFYPLKNISWDEPDLEQVAEQSRAGISARAVPDLTHVKYAYEQAEELASSFGDRGVTVFQPGLFQRDVTWVDDNELVLLVARTVQPRQFKLYEMEREFSAEAQKRIQRSQELEEAGKELAESFRKLMLAGSRLARREAEHRLLIQSMGEAAVGKPGIATPNEFHEWVCDQLNLPVPETVHTGRNQQQGQNTSLEKAVELLAQKALRDDAAYEARLAALEGKKAKKVKAEVAEEVEASG